MKLKRIYLALGEEVAEADGAADDDAENEDGQDNDKDDLPPEQALVLLPEGVKGASARETKGIGFERASNPS